MKLKELRARCYPGSKRMVSDYVFLESFLRRISVYFTFLFVKIGISANATSLLSIFIDLMAFYLLSTDSDSLVVLGAALTIVGHLFDCVDGEIARYEGSTKLGSFLEMTQSYLVDALLLPSVAIGLYAKKGSTGILVLACFGAVSRLLFDILKEVARSYHKRSPGAFRESQSRIASFASWFTDSSSATNGVGRLLFLAYKNLATSSGILLPVLLVLALLKRLDIFVIFFSIENICMYLVAVLLSVVMIDKIVPKYPDQ